MPRLRPPNRTIPDHATTRIDETQLDAYSEIVEIAHGGTSTVYVGEDLATGERVAIKALDAYYVGHSDMVHRLLGEHELAQRTCHPGLLAIHSAEQTIDGIPYLVMEYLEGESLSVLASRRGLPVGTILAIAAQIASAVAALHAAGIVHCDLKPDNVFVLDELGPGGWPRIKVIDYGVARMLNEPALPDGTIVGTPAFMAPEQWHGAPVAKSDVYALGCLLYELVTGVPVFCGALPQLMTAHCERLPERPAQRCGPRSLPRPTALDPDFELLIIRALAKDPEMRPTMAELDTELARLVPATSRLEAVS